jgi:hypothetical protein
MVKPEMMVSLSLEVIGDREIWGTHTMMTRED